ncbi:hypothetical protein ABBQ32_14200 [Trebouxia sp. C0010 RCD-2024]
MNVTTVALGIITALCVSCDFTIDKTNTLSLLALLLAQPRQTSAGQQTLAALQEVVAIQHSVASVARSARAMDAKNLLQCYIVKDAGGLTSSTVLKATGMPQKGVTKGHHPLRQKKLALGPHCTPSELT